MASMCFFSGSVILNKTYHAKSRRFDIHKPCSSQSKSVQAIPVVQPTVRRTANYEPSIWSFDHIQSLCTQYTSKDYTSRAYTLIDAVKEMIHKEGNPLSTLGLVDDLQRLGISYHFEDEIRDVLKTIHDNLYKTQDKWNSMDLNLKSLGFRLLRQHGYQVPQDIFLKFKDEITQDLNPHSFEDIVGVLNLYEASYHSFEDENILDDARDFTTAYLKENLEKINHVNVSSLASHALELPLHWRVPRIEAKWFIQVYEKRSDINPTLIELAKLDFNMVQATHLEDLKDSSRWWQNTSWNKKLSFSRDRLVEFFLWAVGYGYLPQYSLGRRTITKVNSMITTIDDVYDVYGTLDELEQFTDAVNRWDINAIKEFPDYLKICFLGFYNTINEIAYNTLIDTGLLTLPYLTKAWADLCNSYIVEGRWYHSGYTPTLEEYLKNAYVSVSGPVILMHMNFVTSVTSTTEILEYMERAENIVHYSSLIFRLANDLGTTSDEMERGDNPKSIQCYMNESGATEEEARMYIKNLIVETWKKLNKERAGVDSQFSREFIENATNIARMAQFMYSEGDGHGRPEIIKPHVLSLLFNPVQ